MPRWILMIAAPLTAVLTFVVLSAAGTQRAVADDAPADVGVSCVDDLGRSVKLDAPASRVAVLAPFAVDALLDLGVDPVLVPEILGGVPDRWSGLPVLEVNHSSGPNLEQVAAASPDLIVAGGIFARFLPVLERSLGIPVVCLDVDTLDDVEHDVRTLAALVGRDAQADRVVGAMRGRVDAVLDAVPAEGPDVFAMFGMRESNFAFLPDSYLGDLVRVLNGRLITEGASVHPMYSGFTPLSFEAVIAADPDVILIASHGSAQGLIASLERDPAWATLRAVRAGRVVVLPEHWYVLAPGTQPAQALRTLRNAMYDLDD